MEAKKFVIYYESAHWAGAGNHVVVVGAQSEEDAIVAAEDHMQEDMAELYSGEYEDHIEEGGEDLLESEASFTVVYCEILQPGQQDWKFYCNPVQQASFYPEIFV